MTLETVGCLVLGLDFQVNPDNYFHKDKMLIKSCEGGGFNTFGFLSMMIAGYNLVGLIANNGNQNNNNNDNNDNINNNNNQVCL